MKRKKDFQKHWQKDFIPIKSYFFKIAIFATLFYNMSSFSSDFINTMKGIGSSFESFGKSIEAMGKGLGMGFGAPPTGYVYSYTIVNDTASPIYVNTQEIASFMGAFFPKANGWSQATVLPFTQNYNVSNKEYYFEMSIHANNNKPLNHLPYVNPNALYIQDCIQLPADKNSTKINYFHVYMGKEIKQGQYVHAPKAEYMGYQDPSNPKDKNASVVMSNVLTGSPALILYNSSLDKVTIGYSSKIGLTSLQKSDCDLFMTTLQKSSFAFHSGTLNAITKKTSLALGTIGIFEEGSDSSSELFTMPSMVFGGQTYTLEIYKDGQNPRAMGLQALMSAHDVPSGKARDLTPVSAVFWYQSVAQLSKSNAKGMADLPGQVWIISQGEDDLVSFQVEVGSAMQFDILRPQIHEKRWIYCLYIDSTDSSVVKQFIQHFISGKIGANVIKKYKQQGVNLFNQIQEQLSNVLTFRLGSQKNTANSKKTIVPQSLLQEAIDGSLKVNRGQIEDKALNINGYLLGADVFLPQGLGASSIFYYKLAPSQQTSGNMPTASITNEYIMGVSSVPKGMPAPTIYPS